LDAAVDADAPTVDLDAAVDVDAEVVDVCPEEVGQVEIVDADTSPTDQDVAAEVPLACDSSAECPEGQECMAESCVPLCGQTVCPPLPGYVVSCNVKQHCEYADSDALGWKVWDVWIWIPPGEFQMGSPGEGGAPEEQPVHVVTIPHGFFIGKYEIVVEQYEACVAAGTCAPADTTSWDGYGWGTNSSENGRSDHPQNGLSWQRARDFCEWVTAGGRLPSEAEQEYARTGPVHMKYPWGDNPFPACDNDTAVFNESGGPAGFGCGQKGTWAAGSKTAGTSWCGGLDMSGNLWEWCEDYYHPSYDGAPADGSAWVQPADSKRVIRGGSFDYPAVHLRSAARHGTWHGGNHAAFGGRCARPAE